MVLLVLPLVNILLKMLILLSPSKTSDVNSYIYDDFSYPIFKKETNDLVNILKLKGRNEIKSLMRISDKLADQTWEWIELLSSDVYKENARNAIFNYTGEVYIGLNAKGMSKDDIGYAQNHLRILSGLYGVLRPLDLIQLYRLEMATKLITQDGNNLYQFWGDKITKSIDADLKTMGTDLLINLASDEYFKSVKAKQLNARVISVDFFELRSGKKVFVSFSAKKARGLMAQYIIKNRISTYDGLLNFNLDGYHLDQSIKYDNGHITFIKG